MTALEDAGAKVRAHDPAGMDQAPAQLPDVTLCADPYECARGAEALRYSFRALDFKRLAELMASPSIVDMRNVYRPEDVRRRGFRYVGVGISNGNEGSEPDPNLHRPENGSVCTFVIR